jgi:anti-sigma regulatory factor (Ser/Thr protein kinase)
MDTTAVQTFARSTSAPRDARRYVADLLSCWRVADRCTASLLAVSELVTNAVTHGRGPVRVRVALRRSRLRVEVEDEGAGLPAEPHAAVGADDVGGRGLRIVASVASDWGHSRPGDDRSVVWFETPCPD